MLHFVHEQAQEKVCLSSRLIVECCCNAGEGDLAADGQRHRASPEDPQTLEQIRHLKHGCCVVMLR